MRVGAARPLRACAGRPRRASRRGRTLPLRRGARRHTLRSGGPAQVHAPLAGRRIAGHAVEGGPAQVHAPLREARRRSRCGGRTGAGARSLTGGAAAGRAVEGGPAWVHAPLAGRRGGRWWACRRRCTLPGGAAPVALWRANRRRCTLPLREGARRSGYRGWTGAGAHSPRGEARNRSRCGGRTGMGARSLTGGAAPVALWWADRRRCTLPYGRRSPVTLWRAEPAQVHAPLREARNIGCLSPHGTGHMFVL